MTGAFLGFLGSGESVFDRVDSHLDGHNEVSPILPEALLKIRAGGGFVEAQVDLDRIVGETQCVATGVSDTIIFAQRPRRFGLTRFVNNRQPEPCTTVAVVLKKDVAGHYVLITAFIGALAPPEPWDRRAFGFKPDPRRAEAESRAFWSSHALVWGTQEVVLGTETEKSPW